MENREYLEQQIRTIKPPVTAGELDKLSLLSDTLAEWNSKFNLTSITDEKEIVLKHFLDSLQLINTNIVKDCHTICDLGTGAGFPGLPLAIMLPEKQFYLIESNNKKITFLQHMAEALKLNNIQIICERSEELAREGTYREKFDCAVSRALAKFPIAMEISIGLVKKDGFVAYYASQKQKPEIQAQKNLFEKLKCRIESMHDYSLPDNNGDHSIIIVKKLWKTDGIYPRQFGKIKKNPL